MEFKITLKSKRALIKSKLKSELKSNPFSYCWN